jgi:hypothetical protein
MATDIDLASSAPKDADIAQPVRAPDLYPGDAGSTPAVGSILSDEGIRALKARLATKLTKILDDIEDAPKTGRNKDQGYDYQSAKDIVSVTRKVMAKHGVFLKWVPNIPGITWREYLSKSNNLQREATIPYDAVFMDAETGYEEVIPWPGVGVDGNDKSLAKAATAAMKTFLATQFQIGDGSTENDRGESEDGTRSRNAPRGQQQRTENVWPKKIGGILQKIEAHQDGSYVFVKGARFWARKTDIEMKLAGSAGKLIEFEADMGKGPDGLPCPVIQKLLAVPPTPAQSTPAVAQAPPQAKAEPKGATPGPGNAVRPPERKETVPPADRPSSVPSTSETQLERELAQPSNADLFPATPRRKW